MKTITRRSFVAGTAAVGCLIALGGAEAADANHESRQARQEAHNKVLEWGNDVACGDCRQKGGKLTIKPDGKVLWDCQVMTIHTTNRDIWHSHFDLYWGDPKHPIVLDNRDSPNMPHGQENHWFRWHAEWDIPAADRAKIPRISKAVQRSSA